MNLAITLLVALGIASVIGTVLKQNEDYGSYLIKFGPFWHEIFKALGLYDVYIAGWFLFLLGFLVASTAVCVIRNAPLMLRDMRHFRLDVQEKSLRAFHHRFERVLPEPPEAVAERGRTLLTQLGFRVREKMAEDHRVVAGMRGGLSRLGYLFAHVGIIVILVGGTLDSKIPIRIGQLLGQVEIETRNVPASQVIPKARLPLDNPSLRGNINIPEGSSANVVFIGMGDGYLVQPLPFDITVKDFRVEHYATGQPKSFESDIVLTDPDLDQPIEATISVNHPLIHKGYAIYQASFGDGGSKLKLRLWSLYPERTDPIAFTGEVFSSYNLDGGPEGKLKLELTDFRLFNIEPVPDGKGGVEQKNIGPSFTWKLRREDGTALEYQSYMNPQPGEGGRLFFMSGVRSAVAEPFRFLSVPVDPKGSGIKRFMVFVAYVHDRQKVAEVLDAFAGQMFAQTGLKDEQVQEQVRGTLKRLVGLFAEGGYDAVLEDVNAHLPEDKREQGLQAFVKMLHSALQALYRQMLEEQEGIEVPDEADWQFYEDAVLAMGAMHNYGSPWFPQLDSFEHIQSAGLQITRSPGKDLVYLGSAMLIVGVFLMFYLAHQRIWIRIRPREDGGSQVLVAGTSNRNPLDFGQQFARLEELFDRAANQSEDNVRPEAPEGA